MNASLPCADARLSTRSVFVRSLEVNSVIGVCPCGDRRRALQPIVVTFVLAVYDEGPLAADTLDMVVCYEKLINGIQTLCNAGPFTTLTELAERIATLCLQDARVLNARVRVEKRPAAHEKYAIGVEVELP